jgi:glycosyltransferase involved in cell wall biosynthesis
MAHVKAQADPRFQIVQVNLQSDRGGDGRIVSALHERYKALGYPASLLVGRGAVTGDGKDLLPNAEYRSPWARGWLAVDPHRSAYDAPESRLSKLASWIAEPRRRLRTHKGYEDFEFPATLPVLSKAVRERPTILHLHNLHGGYFDLRALTSLTHLAPVVLTLHDQWAFTGHCAHSFGCERWKSGCGECPDLTIYPGIPRDRTAENFKRKRQIFSQTRLYLSAPSKWLMDRAEQSLLAPAIEEARVIPNGVDTAVFHPGDQAVERSRLGLPLDSQILMCAGSVVRSHHWTDQLLLRSTIQHLAKNRVGCTVLFLGSPQSSQEEVDGIQVIHQPYERDTSRVASYYRAADVYLHPARADTFPTTVIESLACGLPVVATSVGGIPEQVRSLWATTNAPGSPLGLATGILVDSRETLALGRAVEKLLHDEPTRRQLSENGSRAAVAEFDITHQVEHYLDWYRQILNRRHPSDHPVARTPVQKRGLPR